MATRKDEQKNYAKHLYTSEKLTKKEVAERVGVTQKTIGRWVKEGNWDELRRSLLVTKEEQLIRLYDQLEWITNHIATRDVVYDIPASLLKPVIVKDKNGNEKQELPTFDNTNFPVKIGNVANAKEADVISKITSSINRLETEISIGDVVTVAKEYIQFTRTIDIEFSKKATHLFDVFINDKLK